jgi:hypothetical protein
MVISSRIKLRGLDVNGYGQSRVTSAPIHTIVELGDP